jgi:serine protease Do
VSKELTLLLTYAPLTESLVLDAEVASKKVAPAVVTVFGIQKITKPSKNADGDSNALPISAEDVIVQTSLTTGTGFFISADGFIITNKHVVANEKARYSVVLNDGSEKRASVVYRDPEHDIAILKVRGADFPAVELGDSSDIRKGLDILDIGNPYSRNEELLSFGSVTGVNKSVSAFNASTDSEESLTGLIEINAQLYPGDSGGPLFDYNGKVIGVNVAAAKNLDNIGYSIPINTVKQILIQEGLSNF